MKSFIAFAALLALAPHAAAQRQAAKPHPADPAASVPTAKYESAFTSYRGFREEPIAPWRDVNEEVARVGGHIGIVRGAARQAPAPGSGTAKPPQSPANQRPVQTENSKGKP